MVIKSLIENTTDNPTLDYEHGLSLYIESNHHKFLFDMGQTDAYLKNASKMGVDIQDIEIAFISHGHYDHGGGLEAFFKANQKADVYVAEGAFGGHYSKRSDGTMKYIGLDQKFKEHPRIKVLKGEAKIGTCLQVLKNKRHGTPLPSMNKYLYKKVNGSFVRDDFTHEQNLMIHCEGKTVLIVGCAHNGILNILDTYEKEVGTEPNLIIGGFHLSSGSRKEIEPPAVFTHLIDALGRRKTEYYTCHCTGEDGYERLREGLDEQINYLSGGRSIHI